jgi:hypothetical protein
MWTARSGSTAIEHLRSSAHERGVQTRQARNSMASRSLPRSASSTTGLGQMAILFGKRTIYGLFLYAAIALVVGIASALAAEGACHRTASAGSPLQRQIAAIRKLELKYDCETGKGGSFSLCRDLANRRARILRHASWRNHVVVGPRSCQKTARKRPVARAPEVLGSAANAAFYCVRLSDGYFFPAPRSQFMSRAEIPAALEQCRFICNDPAMALFTRRIGSEPEDMRALHGRSRYGDLSTRIHSGRSPPAVHYGRDGLGPHRRSSPRVGRTNVADSRWRRARCPGMAPGAANLCRSAGRPDPCSHPKRGGLPKVLAD